MAEGGPRESPGGASRGLRSCPELRRACSGRPLRSSRPHFNRWQNKFLIKPESFRLSTFMIFQSLWYSFSPFVFLEPKPATATSSAPLGRWMVRALGWQRGQAGVLEGGSQGPAHSHLSEATGRGGSVQTGALDETCGDKGAHCLRRSSGNSTWGELGPEDRSPDGLQASSGGPPEGCRGAPPDPEEGCPGGCVAPGCPGWPTLRWATRPSSLDWAVFSGWGGLCVTEVSF